MPRIKDFNPDKKYVRVIKRIPADTAKAMDRINADIRRIAPNAEPMLIFKQVGMVNGQVVGTWEYNPPPKLNT